MKSRKPDPIRIPKEPKSTYVLTNNGVFSEGDIFISRDGCIIGNTDSPASRPSSRSSNSSLDGSKSGRFGVDDASDKVDDADLYSITLNDLQEVGVIGSGSSGVVYKVRVKSTGQPLVRKVIHFDISDEEIRRRVCTELRTLYGAASPFVVRYYQSFFDNGAITIVMEYLDGGSLTDLVKNVKFVSEPYLAQIAKQVLKGLQYLHRDLKIIHRDIKPSNLLLSTQGDVKISDFGVSGQLNSSVSECKSWVGTVTYMSPERIKGGTYSYDSDIWSLGLSLVECALGCFPYPLFGENGVSYGFFHLLEYILNEPPPSLPLGMFTAECCDFMERCLAKEPRNRASVAQLLKHPWLSLYPDVSLADIITTPKQGQI